MGISTRQKAAETDVTEDANPRAVIGGNNPPPEDQVRIDFREGMIEKLPTYEARIAELQAAAERARVTDDDSAGKVGDLIRMIRTMMSAINDSHKVAKQPFLDAGRAADAMRRELIGPLEDAKTELDDRLNRYVRDKAEKERREREEAERIAAEKRAAEEQARREAEEAGRPAPEPEPEPEPAPEPEVQSAPIRSSVTGGDVSTRTVKKVRVTDWRKAAAAVSDDEKVREAVEAAALRRAKAGIAKMAGVEVYDDVQAVAR